MSTGFQDDGQQKGGDAPETPGVLKTPKYDIKVPVKFDSGEYGVSGQDIFFRKIGPDRLEYRGGGGCLAAFGAPLLLVGLLIVGVTLPMTVSSLPFAVFSLFGLAAAVLGAALVLGRFRLTVDLGSRRVRTWRGFLFPLKRTNEPLDLYSKVVFDRSGGDGAGPATWTVSLAGEARLEIQTSSDYTEARRSAGELALFFSLPLEDSSTGRKMVRRPGRPGESLRDRILRTGEDVRDLPPEPSDMKTKVSGTAGGMIAQIPAIYEGKVNAVYIAFAVAWSGAIWWFLLRHLLELPAPEYIRVLMNGISALVMIGPLWAALVYIAKRNARSSIVIISPAFLVVEERFGRRSTKVEIPINELEDLVLPGPGKAQPPGDAKTLFSLLKEFPTPGITAVSARQVVNIGKGLPGPELAYLYGLMRKTVAGQ